MTPAEWAAFTARTGEIPDPDFAIVRQDWPRLMKLARTRLAALDAALAAQGYDPQGCQFGRLVKRQE